MSLARWAHLAAWDTQWSAKTVVFEISLVVASSLDPPFYTWVTIYYDHSKKIQHFSPLSPSSNLSLGIELSKIERNNIQSCSHESGKSTTKTAWQSWTIKFNPSRTNGSASCSHISTSVAKAEVWASNWWALARTTPMAWRHVTTVSFLKDWSSTPRPADAWNGRHHVMLQDPQTSKPGGFSLAKFWMNKVS